MVRSATWCGFYAHQRRRCLSHGPTEQTMGPTLLDSVGLKGSDHCFTIAPYTTGRFRFSKNGFEVLSGYISYGPHNCFRTRRYPNFRLGMTVILTAFLHSEACSTHTRL